MHERDTEVIQFPTGRNSATFRDKEKEVPSLSRDKGTTGQAKNLAKGRDTQNSGQDRPGQPKSGTGRGKKRDTAEKDVLKQEKDDLKQEKDVLKQEMWPFF